MFATVDTTPFVPGPPEPPAPPSRLDHDLSHQPPGPMLALMLEAIDVASLSPDDQVIVLRHRRRMASHYEAQVYAGVAAVADAYESMEPAIDLAPDAAAAEVAAALRLTRRTAALEMSYALDLQRRLPEVGARLASGDIDVRRAKTIVRGVEHLEPAAARAVVDEVIDEAHRLTSGQLAARLRKLCIDADLDDAVRRYEEALAERRIVTEPTTEGTANLLGLDLPPDQAAAAARHVDEIAKRLGAEGDARSIDQRRADVFLDLLQGLQPGASAAADGGVVDIRIDLTTLAGLDDKSAELAGYGPILADIARQVAERHEGGEWRFTVTHPGTGRPVHVGTTRRRPTRAQRRGIEARYVTCVFPGCRMPARRCDLDHVVPWSEGGHTCECSLFPACRHHHMLKHEGGWRYEALPDGDILWTSPLGIRYTMSGRAP